jgi:hypothetical protein
LNLQRERQEIEYSSLGANIGTGSDDSDTELLSQLEAAERPRRCGALPRIASGQLSIVALSVFRQILFAVCDPGSICAAVFQSVSDGSLGRAGRVFKMENVLLAGRT